MDRADLAAAGCCLLGVVVLLLPVRSGYAGERLRHSATRTRNGSADDVSAQPRDGIRVGAGTDWSGRRPARTERLPDWPPPSAASRTDRLATAVLASRWARIAVGVGTAALCWLLLGHVAGPVTGLLVGVGTSVCLQRLAGLRRPLRESSNDLPLAFDLLAGCLGAGRPPDRAAEAVGAALSGPVGASLLSVSRSLRLGADPDGAWQLLAQHGLAPAAIEALGRCADSGAALSAALRRQAVDLRAARAARARAAVHRAGVLVVLPLGLCFLPAFISVGVLPLVVGVLARVLRGGL